MQLGLFFDNGLRRKLVVSHHNQTTIVYSSLPIYPFIPPVPNHGIKTMDIWISIHLTFQHSLQLYNEMKKIFLERLSNCLFNFYILKTNLVHISLFSMMIFERLIHPRTCTSIVLAIAKPNMLFKTN